MDIFFICSFLVLGEASANDKELAWRSEKLRSIKTVAIAAPYAEAVAKLGDDPQQTLPALEKPLSDIMLKEVTTAFEEKGYQVRPITMNSDDYELLKKRQLKFIVYRMIKRSYIRLQFLL